MLLAVSCAGDDEGGDEAGDDTTADVDTLDCDVGRIDTDDSLTIYSGRTEELVGPLLDEFADKSGVNIEVLYGGDSADTARKISEEGDNSPADVFFSQAPGPLAFLDEEGRLAKLPDDVRQRVPETYQAADGSWIGTSGRVRVLVYDPEVTAEDSLPASVFELTDERYEGRVGVAPSNPSFQDFVSYLRLEIGDEETLAFLEGLADNGVRTYPNNLAIVDAVDRGEIDLGLANHYYVLELLAQDDSLNARNHYFPADDPGDIILVAGAAALRTSDNPELAARFVDFLVSDCAQRYFVSVTREFPLVEGVDPPAGQPPLAEAGGEVADLGELGAEFESTSDLIDESGLGG